MSKASIIITLPEIEFDVKKKELKIDLISD